jgi:hypothetical protein
MATALCSCGFSTTVMLMGSPFGEGRSASPPFLRHVKLGTGSPFTFTWRRSRVVGEISYRETYEFERNFVNFCTGISKKPQRLNAHGEKMLLF